MYEGVSIGITHVLKYLASERTLADRRETQLEFVKVCVFTEPGETLAVTRLVSKGKLVDDADQAI